MIAQGYDLTKNAYHNRFQPYIAYWGVFWTIFFILVNGFNVFFDFNATGFLTACMCYIYLSPLSMADSGFSPFLDINIPIFAFLYFGYKIIMRTKIWKPTEMDFVTVSLDQMTTATSSRLTISPFFFIGHPYCGRNRTAVDPTKELLGACCSCPFLSKYYVLCFKIMFYFLFLIINIRVSTFHFLHVGNLYFPELTLHPHTIHLELPFPVHNEASIYT